MHKVRGNYGSGTRGAAKISPTAAQASGKGEDGVKPGRAQEVVRFRVWPPIEGQCISWEVFLWSHPVFVQTRQYWRRVSLSLRKTLRNTLKTGARMFKYPVEKRFNWYIPRFSRSRWSSLCGKTSDSRSENRNEDIEKGSHWKSENPPDAGFYPAFAFEHLQHHPGDDKTDLFPPSKFSFVLFRNPARKTQTTWTDHRDGPTFSVAVRSH